MKHIRKGPPSQHLTSWKHANKRSPQNLHYEGGLPKNDVRTDLLTEQNNLCAYTMLRITLKSSHIEHIKPQTLCKAEDQARIAQGITPKREDIEWSNMVACSPGNGQNVPYGAQAKSDWWNATLFISPLNPLCASRFTFLNDGSVKAADPSDAAALETIKRLQLNHELLKEKRMSAFKGAGLLKTSPSPISASAAARLVKDPSAMEFPEAVRQVARVYECKLQAQSQRMKK